MPSHKRVLLAEESETIRGVAGTVLRQNGFEVIAVSGADKALEVLNLSKPDLLLLGGELSDQGGRPLFERIKADTRFASIPMLLFSQPGSNDLPFPPEVIVEMPFDPKEFMDRVMVFVGQSNEGKPVSTVNPLEGADVEEGAIDAALGLDQIEVTNSEVMDKTFVGRAPAARPKDKLVGFDADHTDEDLTDSAKIESIMIGDEQTDIVQKSGKKKPPPPLSSTGKLEILTDSEQYAMNDPETLETQSDGRPQDYDWFLREMQKEASGEGGTTPAKQIPAPSQQSDKITFTEPSETVESSAPPPDSAGPGVDKFLDEFKKEVEKMQEGGTDNILLQAEQAAPPDAGSEAPGWEDVPEDLSHERFRLFTKELADALAEKIAHMIVTKIDNDKLLAMIKSEIMARISRTKTP